MPQKHMYLHHIHTNRREREERGEACSKQTEGGKGLVRFGWFVVHQVTERARPRRLLIVGFLCTARKQPRNKPRVRWREGVADGDVQTLSLHFGLVPAIHTVLVQHDIASLAAPNRLAAAQQFGANRAVICVC